MRRKRSRLKLSLGAVATFVIMAGAAFLGFQYFTKTGIFRVPGVVYYDESLSAEEKAILENIFTEEIDLDKDVTISAVDSFNKPELAEGEFLYSVEVPVTDFYSTDTDVAAESPELLYADTYTAETEFNMIGVDELDFQQKLLSINGEYYLDTLDSGAVFRTIKFSSEKYKEEIEPLVAEAFTKVFPEKADVLTMAQTGVTALSRGMNAKLGQVGDAKYFSEKIAGFLAGFDITHTSNEASFTDYASASNICSDKRFIDTLLDIGLDVVELTGNHNEDCGDEAARESIDIYTDNGIKIVGGGKTADEAAVPLEIDEKGTGITFLAYNLSTGGATLDNTPGANQYYEENTVEEIAAAKARGDFVLIDVQYYECSSYDFEYESNICDYANSAAGDQVGFFRHLIDLGADMVVGTSAHQPQTFELYSDGVIYYGLGNLFFDQVWWPGTTRSLILSNYFYKGKLLQTKVVPTVYDAAMQTELMDEETAKWFLGRLIGERP